MVENTSDEIQVYVPTLAEARKKAARSKSGVVTDLRELERSIRTKPNKELFRFAELSDIPVVDFIDLHFSTHERYLTTRNDLINAGFMYDLSLDNRLEALALTQMWDCSLENRAVIVTDYFDPLTGIRDEKKVSVFYKDLAQKV